MSNNTPFGYTEDGEIDPFSDPDIIPDNQSE